MVTQNYFQIILLGNGTVLTFNLHINGTQEQYSYPYEVFLERQALRCIHLKGSDGQLTLSLSTYIHCTVYMSSKTRTVLCDYQFIRARICKNFKGPRNRFPALRASRTTLFLRTGPPGYIGWWNRFLGIESWAPLTFTNSGYTGKQGAEKSGTSGDAT